MALFNLPTVILSAPYTCSRTNCLSPQPYPARDASIHSSYWMYRLALCYPCLVVGRLALSWYLAENEKEEKSMITIVSKIKSGNRAADS